MEGDTQKALTKKDKARSRRASSIVEALRGEALGVAEDIDRTVLLDKSGRGII